ncbi:DUF6160 family protein [Marinobacter excellens]|uniref:DUF6160 domain-containing protein n=1 Tax=Marinobacter excellens LAMA 842 TaxID=1306954 RepID=A0A137S1N3_9GAMM|nr:DUF6160 family protein [Marinobacter excellens]KXO06314.1 hypothetical protein J122_4088 [Marinobacter excellens LAMA 842]
MAMTDARLSTAPLLLVSMVPVLVNPVAAMERLDDTALSKIQGQSGITLEMELNLSADRLSYYDDGKGVHLEGMRVGSSRGDNAGAFHRVKVDIGADASLNLDYLVEDRRVEFSDIRLAGAPGVGMGGIFFDHSLQGSLRIRQGGAVGGSGYTFDTAYTMTGGRLGYRTNGNSVFLDDITMDVQALGVTLDVVGDTLQLVSPEVIGNWSVGAIRYSNEPGNYGQSYSSATGLPLPSYGGLQGHYELSSVTDIRAGGRSGEGLRLDNETIIHTASFIYLDDGNGLALRDITGDYRIHDLRLDVSEDGRGRPAVALTLGGLQGNLNIGSIEVGSSGQSFGSLNLSFLLEDQIFNGRTYRNELYLQGGGHPDAGPQGLRMATEWSLRLADLSYTEDGNRVIFSGLQSWGSGDVTVNVTRNEVRNGTRFYDGLRIGFEGLEAGYRINGLRVGSDDAPLQGGTELLLALGFYPAYEFELDGHITLGAGGASGEGLTINSDIQIRDGKAAVIAAPYDEGNGEIAQKGLWLTEMTYDGHVRDMTLDVTEEGLAIGTGESWSTMDIGNVRVGTKDHGASMGRLRIQKYQTGSTALVKPGGAGDICVGGSGSSEGACVAAGGQWETRGNEGVTIDMVQVLARAEGDDKKNALMWESNRAVDSQGRPINNTGMKLLVNDIYTSDGGDFDGDGVEDNRFGIRTDLSVDVYQTRVTKKEDGPDAQGVVGSRGDEKIMSPGSAAGYRYVANPGPGDIANRPLGFAVKADTRFKELSINNIDLIHPVGGSQTVVYGAKFQNVDIRANLTATPIP